MSNYMSARAQFTRPANTTAYTAGDLVANDTTVGNVVPLQFSLPAAGRRRSGKVKNARLQKSSNTATNATFRLHLFTVAKTLTNGDNGALVVNDYEGYIGSIALSVATGGILIAGANVITAHSSATDFNFQPTGSIIYGYLEATGAYAPASGEVFVVDIDVDAG